MNIREATAADSDRLTALSIQLGYATTPEEVAERVKSQVVLDLKLQG